MKSILTLTCLLGLLGLARVSAEPLIEGRVRLGSGEPVADAQVRLFDMTDLERGAIARALTDGSGYFALPLATLGAASLPDGFALGPNYPNPFNPSTIIPYQLAASSQVRLEVFNLLGQRIATLVDGERPAGFHTATWHTTDATGRAVGAGVYIYRMTVGAASQTGRMVLIDGQAGVSAVGAASVWSGVSGGGGSDGTGERVYGLIVSGSGLVPYVDSAFRVEAGMAPVELVVSSGHHSAGKATDDDCALCDLFDTFNDLQEEEEAEAKEEEEEEAPEEEAPEEVPDDAPVTIPDANLRAAIEATLGKVRGSTITKAEMATLREFLPYDSAIISDLSGLEFATNLRQLLLRDNQITDISPLRGLTNLMYLYLEGNQIADISPLRGLTNLMYLYLEGNQIADISPLRGLTNLLYLSLDDNQITDISPLRGLTNLRQLRLHDNQITDISPLRGLTSLEDLYLEDNQITDISPLRGLTNLRQLYLRDNQITDISPSPLRGLTSLEDLYLEDNQITDISPLRGLTNLRYLYLSGNQIADISPLRGLTNLEALYLSYNQITDISPLVNLNDLIMLGLRRNPLSVSSINDHIPALKATVLFDKPFREGEFEIELVFLDDRFTEEQKESIRDGARYWMSIIREDLPDYVDSHGFLYTHYQSTESIAIPAGGRIDDLRIYVTVPETSIYDAEATASLTLVRETGLPVVGVVTFDPQYLSIVSLLQLMETTIHEIGHVLGIGTLWDDLLQGTRGAYTHFKGPLAIRAFDDAGGRNYAVEKVPVEPDGAHWRYDIFQNEVLASSGGHFRSLSAITVQALADLGWVVDVTQADPLILRPPFDFAAKVSAEPKLSCGAGQQQEPIYVVDEQGNIIRTLHR